MPGRTTSAASCPVISRTASSSETSLGVGDRHQFAVPQDGDAIAETDDLVPAVRDEEDDGARVRAGVRPARRATRPRWRRAPTSPRRAAARAACARRRARSPASAAGRAAGRRRRAPGSMSSRWRARMSSAPCAGARREMLPQAVRRRVGQQEIALDAQVAHQGQFLEHAGNAEADGLVGVARGDRLAVERDASAIGNDGAADDLDQRRFAGAVLADEAEDRSGRRLET